MSSEAFREKTGKQLELYKISYVRLMTSGGKGGKPWKIKEMRKDYDLLFPSLRGSLSGTQSFLSIQETMRMWRHGRLAEICKIRILEQFRAM
jgi:hypothetical protein